MVCHNQIYPNQIFQLYCCRYQNVAELTLHWDRDYPLAKFLSYIKSLTHSHTHTHAHTHTHTHTHTNYFPSHILSLVPRSYAINDKT